MFIGYVFFFFFSGCNVVHCLLYVKLKEWAPSRSEDTKRISAFKITVFTRKVNGNISLYKLYGGKYTQQHVQRLKEDVKRCKGNEKTFRKKRKKRYDMRHAVKDSFTVFTTDYRIYSDSAQTNS